MGSPQVSTRPKLRSTSPRRAKRAIAKAIITFSAICGVLAIASMLAWKLAPGWLGSDPAKVLTAAIILGVISVLSPLVLLALRGPASEWERVFGLILEQRRFYSRMLIGSFILVVSELSLPLMLEHVLDDIVNTRQDMRMFAGFMAIMLLLLLVRGAAGCLRTYNAQSLAYNIATGLRHKLYAHLQKLSYSFFDRSRQGELMSKITNDVVVLQNFIMNSSEDFFVAPLKVVGAVSLIFFLNWQLALVVMMTALITALLLKSAGGKLRKINREVQSKLGELTAMLAEGLNTIRLAQSFGLERTELSKFAKSNDDALEKVTAHVRISSYLLPLIEMLGFIAPLVIIGVLSYNAISAGEQMKIGNLLAIAGLGALVANPLGKLSRLFVTLAMGEAASARIHSVLETEPEIVDAANAQTIGSTDGYIEFDQVQLRYSPQDPIVLDRVNLQVMPGKVVALVGESGSGKSSLIHLVPRFYDVTGGAVKLDGTDVRQISMASLRKQIGIVSQDTILIRGTVRENIAYGTTGADAKDIFDAARSANAHDFIMEFPQGYDTMVGERGVTLSGGQLQRIAIARVLLRDPRILLLDEATSALDSVSEAVVQDALNKLMFGRTTMLVAHRLSTVKKADIIVVFKRGRIIELGSHTELLGNPDGEYSRLVRLQGLDQEN